MNLIINHKVINTPISVILNTLRKELNYSILKDIRPEKHNNITVTCPFHKNGNETHPSCNVYCGHDDDTEYGKVHCFTCGYVASLPKFIADCFNEPEEVGKEWLTVRFGTTYTENINYLPEIVLEKPNKNNFLDENILKNYNYYHPYMWERKLTKKIVDKFQVGYDDKNKCITFPVWDDKDNLVMITSRSVISKHFYIDKDKEKPVYLLNFIKKENYSKVYVCESQLDALVLWTWGYPAIALLGTGSEYQFKILNRSGITNFVLCFDGDEAGDKGTEKFKNHIKDDILVSKILIPRNKDVNDLTEKEFSKLKEIYL